MVDQDLGGGARMATVVGIVQHHRAARRAVGKLLFGVSFGYADEAVPVNRIAVGRAPLASTTRFHGFT